MSQTNQVFLTTSIIITLGFLLKKYDFLSEKDGKTISKFLMHTTFPALMFVSVSRANLDPAFFLIPLACIAASLVMLVVAWFSFKKYPNSLRAVLLMGAGAANVGLFGFPIIEGLFGKEALVYAVMYDLGNTIIAVVIMFPMVQYLAAPKNQAIDWAAIAKRVLKLPPVVAMLLGLTVNCLNLELPKLAFDTLDILAKGNKPIVLLLMGLYVSFELDKNQLLGISKMLLIRYAVCLFVIAGFYSFLPHTLMRSTLILCASLPLGMTVLIFSDEMNLDARTAGTLLNLSNLISFGLMWALVAGLGL